MSENRLQAIVASLKPGECYNMDARVFFDAAPRPGLLEGGGGLNGAIDRFLSGCVGSAYGTVRVRQDPIRGHVTISRHEEDSGADHSEFVYHVDPDRQWMFDRVDGGWRRKPA